MFNDKRALLKQRLESGQIRVQPLTFPQRELWEASPVPAGDVANHICCAIEVRGRITTEHVTAAVRQVVQRQEALRISFVPGKDRVMQMIRAEGSINFRARELAEDKRAPEAIDRVSRAILGQPFDLLQGPLYRIEMLSRAADDHVLVFAIHHAIADGWTLGVFVQELCAAYLQSLRGMPEPLPAVPLSYTAWGAAERAFWQPPELAARAAFWKAHLAGSRRLWTALEGADTASGAHRRMVSHFPADLAGAARELARQNGATLFSTLLAAFQIALARWTGEDDILVGTPVANRPKQTTHETMGSFAGIVPLRGRVEAARPFSASVRAVHRMTVECFANAMPFVELARALGDTGAPGHNPVFEVRFALQNHPIPEVALPGLSAKLRMISTGTARFHLGCEITEDGDELEVVWLFRPQLFAKEEVENLSGIFESILARPDSAAPAGAGCVLAGDPGVALADSLHPRLISDRPSGTADSGAADFGTTGSGTIESGTVDVGTAESGTVDVGTADSGITDSGTADFGRADFGAADSRTTDPSAESGREKARFIRKGRESVSEWPQSVPEGRAEISRGWSVAEPPETSNKEVRPGRDAGNIIREASVAPF